jgi:hypothetical protein
MNGRKIMSRWTKLVAVITLVLAATVARTAPDTAEVKKETPRTSKQTRDRLAKPVDIVAIDANTSLKDALGFASEKFDVTIHMDIDAFKSDLQIMEPENQPVGLAKMDNVRLENWLRMILHQGQADFFVQGDGIIRVVPRNTLVDHILGQKVTANFEKKPVSEALKQVSEQTGLSIVLDERRAGDKAKTVVSADLQNVSLDAALLLLSDLAELKTVTVDRAVYVTTRENAREIRAELERKRAEKDGVAPPMP